MKKVLFTVLLSILFSHLSFGQKYFKPMPGGVQNSKDGGDFYKVELKGKSAQEIYDVLYTMVKENFDGEEDEILETVEGELIVARGVLKRYACQKNYNVNTEVEFKIKDGRYIFLFNRFNLIHYKTENKLLLRKGSNFLSNLSSEKGDDGKTFVWNKKGKMILKKSCFKDINSSLDVLGSLFDVSDEYDKYADKKKKNEKDW